VEGKTPKKIFKQEIVGYQKRNAGQVVAVLQNEVEFMDGSHGVVWSLEIGEAGGGFSEICPRVDLLREEVQIDRFDELFEADLHSTFIDDNEEVRDAN
jgi:hypothetical protein